MDKLIDLINQGGTGEYDARQPQERGEAVAWRFNLDGMWFVASKRETCQKELEAARLTAEIEPLYTHPPADAQRVSEKLHQIVMAAAQREIDAAKTTIAALESQLAESAEARLAQANTIQRLMAQLTASQEREGRMRETLADLRRDAIVLGDEYLSAFREWDDNATIQGWGKGQWLRLLQSAKKADAALAAEKGE